MGVELVCERVGGIVSVLVGVADMRENEGGFEITSGKGVIVATTFGGEVGDFVEFETSALVAGDNVGAVVCVCATVCDTAGGVVGVLVGDVVMGDDVGDTVVALVGDTVGDDVSEVAGDTVVDDNVGDPVKDRLGDWVGTVEVGNVDDEYDDVDIDEGLTLGNAESKSNKSSGLPSISKAFPSLILSKQHGKRSSVSLIIISRDRATSTMFISVI